MKDLLKRNDVTILKGVLLAFRQLNNSVGDGFDF